jgi:hypothetical protein
MARVRSPEFAKNVMMYRKLSLANNAVELTTPPLSV